MADSSLGARSAGSPALRKRAKVSFCWVPGHVGIVGNEAADKASKSAAAGLQQTSAVSIPHGDFKEIIRTHVKKSWQQRWSSLTDNAKLKGIHPQIRNWDSSNCPNRRDGIILTRLRIGHTRLTHGFLMTSGDERQVPFCHTCQSTVTVQHILMNCLNFSRERGRCGLSGKSMSDLLGEYCDVSALMRFLKLVNHYHQL